MAKEKGIDVPMGATKDEVIAKLRNQG